MASMRRRASRPGLPTTEPLALAASVQSGDLSQGPRLAPSADPRLAPTADPNAAFSSGRTRTGFTLLEVLIATAATLLMMLSLAQIFKIIGDSMKQGRAGLEMNNRLRSAIYRIRQDLNNLTVSPKPPADGSTGTGYFKYFDGSVTDYSCMLFDSTNGSNSAIQSDVIRSSRFGDFDDILMYTARSGESWFTGKVPLFVLKGTPPSSPADLVPVTIAAQHAEIAIFTQPLVNNVGNPDYDQGLLVATPTFFLDADGNGIPDEIRLHYRTLLIRPDLNMASGHLPANSTNLIAQRQSAGSVPLPSPLCDMTLAHQQCDLSIRRVFNPNDGLAVGTDFVAANSLDDLMNPANRFAHVQLPVPGTAASVTMPLLALGPRLGINVNPSVVGLSDPLPTSPINAGSGFLHPAFALQGGRVGEDILAPNVLAFDVKGYDSSVEIITMYGPDGVAGSTGDNVLGASGSDDVVVTPNEPGYAPAMLARGSTSAVSSYGGYVDLMWGRKVLNSARYFGINSLPNPVSELSGLSASGFIDSLYSSGNLITAPATAPLPTVLQPTYDTWTTHYEGDGILQAPLGFPGVIQINRGIALFGASGNDLGGASPPWRRPYIDAGTDGLDNNSAGGTDDVSELETRPPFPVHLRGVKVTLRIEDAATRQVKQMSVANEFVTQ